MFLQHCFSIFASHCISSRDETGYFSQHHGSPPNLFLTLTKWFSLPKPNQNMSRALSQNAQMQFELYLNKHKVGTRIKVSTH